MPSKKETYEDRFSGRTRAIIRTLSNIFIDSGMDVRHKHMFGHKAFLIGGNVFMLVGEWARVEKKKEKQVDIASKGEAVPTVMVIPPDEAMAEALRKKHGGLYFTPGGTRLKLWLSFTGDWLVDEDELEPVVQQFLEVYGKMPMKKVKNPGLLV